MKKLPILMALLLILAVGVSSVFAQGISKQNVVKNSYHQDHRSSLLKQEFIPASAQKSSNLSGETVARQYLNQNAAKFGLDQNLSNLTLVETKESLLGTHYYFAQKLNGIAVDKAGISVSVSNDGAVYKVYNNTYPTKNLPKLNPANRKVNQEQAFDTAWNHLRVHGTLMAQPKARLAYVPSGDTFTLVQITTLAVDAPYGHWEHQIDAFSGEVLSFERTELWRKGAPKVTEADLRAYRGPVKDRKATFSQFSAKQQQKEVTASASVMANGTGYTFDPDPKTTLADDNLNDTSSAASFNGSYFNKPLLDITYAGGVYSLTGPWVTIASFDKPNTAPSTTTDGNWTALRGDNAFNDSMTYFQVDQNQRYIQSLGFTGAKGIQETSIDVDTDAINGGDNSWYSPSGNQMAFGHGGVDDNEDAFVILHEYGHAIHHSINSNWSGGDTGAMGEGFGDYWGGSYRYSFPNGQTFHYAWAFPWDGHNQFWGGRDMDVFEAQYDPSQSYGAHEWLGSYSADELWSTPLFQSLVTLIGQGVAREEVDTLILEAHFGIAAGPSMRDMANAIVATAQTLYPTGPHADVFIEKFMAHNILEAAPGGPVTETYSGSVRTEIDSFNISVAGDVIDLSLAFSGKRNPDLDVYLYAPGGALVASSATSANPETLTYDATGNPGSYQIEVHNATTSRTSYDLTVTYQP